MPGPAPSVKFPSAQAELGRQWNIQNPSLPNPGPRPDVPPCRCARVHKFEVRVCLHLRTSYFSEPIITVAALQRGQQPHPHHLPAPHEQ